jgi:hypothetical protein
MGFVELKRAYSEGAVIEYFNSNLETWEDLPDKPKWYDNFQYRIKGGISIEQWDKWKDLIKFWWAGAEIEYRSLFTFPEWKEETPIWAIENEYRIKQSSTKDTVDSCSLSIEDWLVSRGCEVNQKG